MNKCQNCGNSNTPESNFCRFCGNKFLASQPAPQMQPQSQNNPYGYAAPRPYAWKTDEFQTQNEARRHSAAQATAPISANLQPALQANQQVGFRAQTDFGTHYRCPRCGTSYLPETERRISTAGWIVFSALLVFTVVFFWVGLLMKENVAVCPVCKSAVS